MSQVDNTGKTRSSSMAGGSGAKPKRMVGATDLEPQEPIEDVQGQIPRKQLRSIMERLEMAEKSRKVQEELVRGLTSKVTKLENKVSSITSTLVDSQLQVDCYRTTNRRLQLRLDFLENDSKKNNLRIDGLKETDRENLRDAMTKIARAIGVSCVVTDIAVIYRIGKQRGTAYPRSVMVKLNSTEKRNEIFFSRTKLKGNLDFPSLWINDDVNEHTRQMRDDMRAVAQLCSSLNTPCRVHTDGIIIGDRPKIKNENSHELPPEYSLSKAKTVKVGNEVYYQGPHSPLSNLHPCKVQIDGKNYNSSEQAFQCLKAENAGDLNSYNRLIKEDDQYEIKRIGSAIEESVNWKKERLSHMKRVVKAKYSQNNALKKYILELSGTPHEATRDQYWGVGARLGSKPLLEKTWTGSDHMGGILREVQAELR